MNSGEWYEGDEAEEGTHWGLKNILSLMTGEGHARESTG